MKHQQILTWFLHVHVLSLSCICNRWGRERLTSRISWTTQRIFHRASSCPGHWWHISPGWGRRDPKICRGGPEPSAQPPPLCFAGMSCFASSGYARLFCTSSKHAFLHYFSILHWDCVFAAANRASHCNKMSLLQEQRSVSTEGTKNVEKQAARRTQSSHLSPMGLIKIWFYVPAMAVNVLNVSDRKTEVMVLGGTAGTCPADVGSLAH